MTAFEELESGARFGPQTYSLLLRLVRQVARRFGFPPPQEFATWTESGAAEEAVQRLFDKRKAELAVEAYVKATDQGSLERLLLKKIEWALKDEARATETGKIRARIRGILESDKTFEDATALWGGTHAWTLPANGDAVWQGDVDDLVALSTSLDLQPIPGLNPSGPTPAAVSESFRTVIEFVLRTVSGAIRDQDLAMLIAVRFDLDPSPDSLDEPDTPEPSANENGPAERAESQLIADKIYAQLSDQDRAIISDLDLSLADFSALHATIRNPRRIIAELKGRLRVMIDELGYDPLAIKLVLEMCAKALPENAVSPSDNVVQGEETVMTE